MTDPAVAKAISEASANAEVRNASGRVNAGKMSAFAPGAADLSAVGIDPSKIPGLAGTPGVEKGTGNDIRSDKA